MSTWKNLCKRGFAVFLSLTLCLSLMNVSAFAAETEDTGSDDSSISDTQTSSDTSTESGEDEDGASESGEDEDGASESGEDEDGETQTPAEGEDDANKPVEGENGETQTPDEGEDDANKPAEGENGEPQTPAEGEEDASKPAEGENGETQTPDEGEDDANKPVEGENGETQTPDEGEGDASKPVEGENGETQAPEGEEDANKPVEGENGETQTPDEEETSGALGEFLSKIEAIGSGELDMDGILSAIDDCLSSYEQLSEEEKAALAEARDALLTYQGELTGVLPDPIAPQLPELPEVPQAPQYSDAVQAFLDAAAQLPEEVTEENVEEVGAALEAILPLYQSLSEEEQNMDVVVSAYIRVMAVYEQYTGVMAQLMDGVAAQIGDNAYDTLQEAVSAAQDGDVIVLLKPVAESITVSKSVTFDLNGHNWTGNNNTATLTTNGKDVAVVVQNGSMNSVTSRNVIVTSGGTLTLNNIVIKGQRDCYDILKASSTAVIINGGEFSDNSGFKSGGYLPIKITNGSLEINGAVFAGNNAYHLIDVSKAAIVSIKGARFEENVTTATDSFSMGGGGMVRLMNTQTSVEVSDTRFTNNRAKDYGAGLCVYNPNAGISLTIEGCTFTGNVSEKTAGAVYVNNPGNTTITDTVITDNTANGKPSKVMCYGNYGGGLYVNNTTGTVTLSGTTRVYNNHTPNDTQVSGTNDGGSADIALYSTKVGSSSTAKNPANFSHATLILDCETSFTGENGNKYTLTQFDRTLVNKNGYYWSSGSNYYWPMGYYTVVEEPVRVYLNGEHTGDKVVTTDILAEAVEEAQREGQNTVYVCGTVTVTSADEADLNSGVTFVRCEDHPTGYMFKIEGSVTLNGAHIDGMSVEGNASMIYVPRGGHLTIAGNTLIENGKNTKGDGGAIYVHQGSLTMTGGTIQKNYAKGSGRVGGGGGIYAYSDVNLIFEGGRIQNNSTSSTQYGGGLLVGFGNVDIGVQGGRTVFESNVSAMGGGIYFLNSSSKYHYRVYAGDFLNNEAVTTNINREYYPGGGIYVSQGATVEMKNLFATNNQTTRSSGMAAVSTCPTGSVAFYEVDGALIVNNRTNSYWLDAPDIAFNSHGNTQAYVSENALGGGHITFTDEKGKVCDSSVYQWTTKSFSIYTKVSGEAIEWARENAQSRGVVMTGNKATYNGSAIGCNGTLIIGTETKSVKVVKEWTDGADKHVNDQVLVYLTRDGKIVDADTRADASVILSEANDWSYTWTNLDPNHEWSFKEAAVPGYTSVLSDEVQNTEFALISDQFYIRTLTNTPSTEESERLVISKTAYGLDPDASYKFTLKLDNVGDKVFSIQLPDGSVAPIYNNEITFYLKDGQSAVVEGLPVGYTYEVTEEENPAYKSFTFDSVTEDVNGSITSVMVVNLPLVSITVQKLWNDTDDAAFRPESITVNLMNGEMVMDTAVVTPDENGNWFHTFADLPEYDAEGNKIAYTVKEVGADDYDAKYELNTDGVWVITNTLRRGSLTINKAVVGGGGEAANKEFTFTVTGADENTKDYKETVTIKGAGTGVLQGLLPGAYTVTEADASISGYTWNVSGTGSVTVEANKEAEDTTNVNVTNTYTENKPLDGSLTITKVIRGGGSEAQNKTYTFTVTGPDGYNRTVTITGEGSVTLSPLTPGVYTVTEDRAGAVISGYTLTISGSGSTATVVAGGSADVTVTNTYTTPGGGDPGDPEDPEDPTTPPPTPEIPDEEVPLTDIPEEDVPLTEIPEEPEELEIPEENVPLAEVPETGDLSGNWMMAMLMGALGMLWMALTGKKRSEEEG